MRKIPWLPMVLLLALAEPARALDVGKPAPPLTAKLLDGSRFSLVEHKGEVVLITFWACWCEPCRAELAAMDAYYRAHRGEGFTAIAVSMDDPEDFAKTRAIADGLSLPVARYGDAEAKDWGRIWRLPITMIVDRDGRVRADGGAGAPRVYDLPALEAALDPLLKR